MAAQLPLPVLLTRPRAQSERFAASLPAPLAPVISPLLEIVAYADLQRVAPTRILIFTSANGVAAYARLGPGNGQAALCVGDRTAQTALDAGFDATSAKGNADDVVAAAERLPGPFTHVHGAHSRGEIGPRLRALGKEIDTLIAYEQRACSLTAEAHATLAGYCLVPLFSPRTAELFAEACRSAPQAHLICMSPAVAKVFKNKAFAGIKTLPAPNADAMRTVLLAYAAGNNLERGRTSS